MQGRALAKFCVATSGPHKVYTVLAHPTAPWREAKDDPQSAWSYALERACGWADGTTTTNAMMSAVTSNLFYNMGFRYDTKTGKSSYLTGGGFRLAEYFKRGVVKVNCYDQAYGVVVVANLLGASSFPCLTELFGYINATDLVGVPNCNNPFYESNTNTVRFVVRAGRAIPEMYMPSSLPLCGGDDLDRTAFANHMYAFVDGVIFDACAGPSLGTLLHGQYLNLTIDHSTTNETANSYYSPYYPGKIVRYPVGVQLIQ